MSKTIVMAGQMSGTRNGKEWPPAGTRLTLPDDEARGLIASDMAYDEDDPRVGNAGQLSDVDLAGAPEGRDWTEGQPDTNLDRARAMALDERENRLIAREAALRAGFTEPGFASGSPVVGDDQPNPTDQASPLSLPRTVESDGERSDGAGVTVESATVDPDVSTERAEIDTSVSKRGARK